MSVESQKDNHPVITIDPATGLVENIPFVPSPYCDKRPADAVIDVLVIHAISLPPGEFGGSAIEQLFCGALDTTTHPYYVALKDLEVSAHLLIKRDGSIVQFVPLHLRAWHAGPSFCDGRARVNDFSIGVELEGTDSLPFEDIQYQKLAVITKAIMQTYPGITRNRIFGHADIAPGRKTDPGPHFDWERYLKQCA